VRPASAAQAPVFGCGEAAFSPSGTSVAVAETPGSAGNETSGIDLIDIATKRSVFHWTTATAGNIGVAQMAWLDDSTIVAVLGGQTFTCLIGTPTCVVRGPQFPTDPDRSIGPVLVAHARRSAQSP
jgi:hypothetical protein